MVKKEWKKRTGGLFKVLEEGEEIEGILKSVRLGKYKNDIYDIETIDGLVTIPGSTVLQNAMEGINPGTHVKIKFLGWATNPKGQKYKNFEVYTFEEKTE